MSSISSPEPFHCDTCTGKSGDVDGTDRGFLCPACSGELITPYKNCDVAAHCSTCNKTFNVDNCEHVDDAKDFLMFESMATPNDGSLFSNLKDYVAEAGWATVGIHIAIGAIALAVGWFCFIAALGTTDPATAKRVLTEQGYRDIRITGLRPWVCGRGDTFVTGFSAKSPVGSPITGVVCGGGAFKLNTIRVD
jgi:hypothetical protein